MKEKTIAYCNVAETWASTRDCIDEVLKVTEVAVESCKEIKKFKSYCEDYINKR